MGPDSRPERAASGAALLEALGDPQARQILLELNEDEQDVHQLVLRTQLPQSSVYRKLKQLDEVGLIRIVRYAFTPEGRKVEVYGSRLAAVRIELTRGRIRVELTPREDSVDRLGRIWEQVRRGGEWA